MIEYLIFLVPVLLAVMNAKRYNFIYGFAVFFSFSAFIELVGLVFAKIGFMSSFAGTYTGYTALVVQNINMPLQDLLRPYLPSFAKGYEYFVVIIGVSLVLHIISAICRRHRIERNFSGRRVR